METVSFGKWQDCVDYFGSTEGITSPAYDEFINVRQMVKQVSAPHPPLSGEKSEEGQLPHFIRQGTSQIIDHTARCIAALHAKLPKGTASPAEKGAQ